MPELADLEHSIGLGLAVWGLRQRADEHRRMAKRVENLGTDAMARVKAAEKANLPGGRQAITEHKSEAAAYREVWKMLTAEAQALEEEAAAVEEVADREPGKR